MTKIGELAGHLLARRGWDLVRRDERPDRRDMEDEFLALYDRCAPFTMTSIERMYALYQAVRHVVRAGVPGDVVECGVWRGGSSMLAALVLDSLGDRERVIHLYDTFAGMPEPGEQDRSDHRESAAVEWERQRADDINEWCYAPVEEVRTNMLSTGFPAERVRFVEGKVEDTIPGTIPERISLLRLDTDWYASTYHELKHLYPLLSPGGVLILDDYGYWEGVREATDRFLAESGTEILLTRIDLEGRIGVRTA
jgi:O-methyltransferase